MKLDTLNRDWSKLHPGGQVWIVDKTGGLSTGGKQTGRFALTYETGGKLYTYTATSVYKLAERLHLIPDVDIDYWYESRKAIDTIRSGGIYRSLGGLSDTMRTLLYRETGKDYTIDILSYEIDEYDRTVIVYSGIREISY